MLGPQQVMQEELFYEFSLEGHVPDAHLLRRINALISRHSTARRADPRSIPN